MAASLNQTIYGQISGAYSPDRWTFSALAKQQIRFNLVATGNLVTQVRPHRAERLYRFHRSVGEFGPAHAVDNRVRTPWPPTGFSGAYAFRLDQTSLTDLTPGVTYQGSLAGSAQAQLFRVTLGETTQLLIGLHHNSPGRP